MTYPLKLYALLVGAVLMVGLVVTFSLRSFEQTRQAAEARKHTFLTLQAASVLLNDVQDAETGQRGYLLTGDEAFLQPYLAAHDGIGHHLEEVRRLATTASAGRHLDAMGPLITAKMTVMAQVIELRRRNETAAAQAMVLSGTGKRAMEAFRLEMAGLVRDTEAELAQDDKDLQANLRLLLALIIGGCVLGLFFALSFAYALHAMVRQRMLERIHHETQQALLAQEETSRQLLLANGNLRDSEELMAVTLTSIGDAVLTTDAGACVTNLNPVAERLTGFTQAEAVGRPVGDIFHIISKLNRSPSAIPVAEALERGTIQGLANHTVLISRDGSEYDIADSCAPIRNRERRIVGTVLVFRDVTSEYKAQQAQRDSAVRVQTILDTVVDGIVTIHASGSTVESVNHATEHIFGYTAAEINGRDLGLLIPDLGQHSGLLKRYQAGATTPSNVIGHEVVGRRKDGSEVPLEIAFGEMLLDGQRFFTGILRDLTARKQVEAALVQAGALQQAIYNSANFSSIATDAKGVIQIFNVGAERMLGYAAADMKDKRSHADISDPQELIARAETLSRELGTTITPGFEALVFKASRGIEDIYELTYIRKDGSRFPAVVSVTALRDSKDGIIGYLLIGTDNTARKLVEDERTKLDQRLHDQQFYTRSLIESNLDALMITDSSGILTDVNKEMETLTGRSREELIGTPSKDCFTDPGRSAAGIALVLKERKVTNYELTVRAKDGQETAVSYNATVLYDREGALQGVLSTARDVTERKSWDAQLSENTVELEKAKALSEKANLAKSDFLSSMSHELRSPLNAILGFAQLMESDAPSPSPGQKASIDQILHAGWYLLELINEILDLSVIESGRLSISLEPVSLADVMLECQAMIEPQALKRGIGMAFPRFTDRCYIKADRTRLKQVLINLLSNSIKYNQAGGTVSVALLPTGNGGLRISVMDTGAGLTPEQMAQLFQPFNRLGQEAGNEEGTGIGLVVSKRLVELMKGQIGVDSHVGKGSTFWIEMQTEADPGSTYMKALNATTAEPPPAAERQRVLLYVEDNLANLQLMERLIARRPDMRLLTAQNGTVGLAIARSSLPEVILMDINLPGISGIETMRLLRDDPATAHIPIVALSANAMPRDIEKGLETGFFRYLTKPIKVNEFMETLLLALAANPQTAAPGNPG